MVCNWFQEILCGCIHSSWLLRTAGVFLGVHFSIDRALKLWFIDVLRGLKTVKQIQQVLVRCSATKKLYTDVQGTAMRVQDEERTAEDAVMECHLLPTAQIQ